MSQERVSKLIGLISPNLSEDTLVDYYRILPAGIRIEGRGLDVGKYTDSEFHKVEQGFFDLVRDVAHCRTASGAVFFLAPALA